MAFRRGWRKGLRSSIRHGVRGSAERPRPAAACTEWNYGPRPAPGNGFFPAAVTRHARAGGRRRPRGLPSGSITRSGRPPGLSNRSTTSGKSPIGLRKHDGDPFREAPGYPRASHRPADEPPGISEHPVDPPTNPPGISEHPVDPPTNPPGISEHPVDPSTNPIGVSEPCVPSIRRGATKGQWPPQPPSRPVPGSRRPFPPARVRPALQHLCRHSLSCAPAHFIAR
jgi:hypothetical protein